MKIMVRLDVTEEGANELVHAWLSGDPEVLITGTDTEVEARITYVRNTGTE